MKKILTLSLLLVLGANLAYAKILAVASALPMVAYNTKLLAVPPRSKTYQMYL